MTISLVGEVEASERPPRLTSKIIVRSGGFFGRPKAPRVSSLAIHNNLRPPLPASLPAHDAAIAAGVVSRKLGVSPVLSIRGAAKVALPIVESIPVDVIWQHARWAVAEDQRMHADLSPIVEGAQRVATSKEPLVRQDAIGIVAVNDRKLSLRERDEKGVLIARHAPAGFVPRSGVSTPAGMGAELPLASRDVGRRNKEHVAATETGTLNGHGDLQSLCRAGAATNSARHLCASPNFSRTTPISEVPAWR